MARPDLAARPWTISIGDVGVGAAVDVSCHTFEVRILEEIVMAIRLPLRTLLSGACIVLAIVSGSARADETPLVTGEHWTKSPEQSKKAYLIGIANVLQVESAFEGATPPADTQSLVPRFVRGLKGQTLDSVREGLDSWYTAHPDRLQRPVIETIWFEIVVPGLQKTK